MAKRRTWLVVAAVVMAAICLFIWRVIQGALPG